MSLTPKNWDSFQHYKNRSPAWIKLHRGLLDDFEFSRLPVASRALAPLLWLLASEYDQGEITASMEEIAYRLRMSRAEMTSSIKPLIDAGFFVASEMLAERRHDACLEKEREEEKEIDSEPNGSAANAPPPDIRTELFGRGREILERITGKTPNASRSLIGRWLKSVDDEAIHVLAAIEEAERNRIADPVPWITRMLQPRGSQNGPGRPRAFQNDELSVSKAIQRQREAGITFGPRPSLLPAGGRDDLRVLPPGRGTES